MISQMLHMTKNVICFPTKCTICRQWTRLDWWGILTKDLQCYGNVTMDECRWIKAMAKVEWLAVVALETLPLRLLFHIEFWEWCCAVLDFCGSHSLHHFYGNVKWHGVTLKTCDSSAVQHRSLFAPCMETKSKWIPDEWRWPLPQYPQKLWEN